MCASCSTLAKSEGHPSITLFGVSSNGFTNNYDTFIELIYKTDSDSSSCFIFLFDIIVSPRPQVCRMSGLLRSESEQRNTGRESVRKLLSLGPDGSARSRRCCDITQTVRLVGTNALSLFKY